MPIMTPVLLIGGMTTGVFTPTEGAIAACVWALILGLVWYRTLTWRMLAKVAMDTIETTATVMFIVAAASIFGWLLTATRVTDAVAIWVLSFTHSPWVFLLLANLLMLFVGCFLEPTAAILILVPVLDAGDPAARHRSRAFRAGHGAEPDDRPTASADGNGVVRARARRESVDRKDNDGDHAVARAAAGLARADHVRAADLALAAARVVSLMSMAAIERVEIWQVDLAPKVVRTDAIQSFVTQETPIVSITCADGAQGVGYSYTIGTGGSSVVALLRDHLAPKLIGRDDGEIEAIWKDLFFHTHATAVGAITSLALAAVDTALWDLKCRRAGRRCGRGGRRAGTGSHLHDRGRVACIIRLRNWSTKRWRRRNRAFAAPR